MMEVKGFFKARKERIKEKASENNTYDSRGRTILAKDDDWRNETEWDFLFDKVKKERSLK